MTKDGAERRSDGPLLLRGMTRDEYFRLRDKWYARLAKDGFFDIERVDHIGEGGYFLRDNADGVKLRCYDNERVASDPDLDDDIEDDVNRVRFEAQRAYFTRCRQWSHARRIKLSPIKRRVWELHCEGMTVRAIGERLGRSKNIIQSHINQMRRLMEAWWRAEESEREKERDARAGIDTKEGSEKR